MSVRYLYALLFVMVCSPAMGANVGCMVYNNNLIFTETELQRLEAATEIQYVGVQIASPYPHVHQVASRLAASGKKIILQIWWGPDPPYSWSRFSMANIALDAGIREEFFEEVVDPLIDAIGPENIFAAHMLEETGAYYATDSLNSGDPENYSDEFGGRSSFLPFYSGWSSGSSYGGPWTLTLRRHNADFRRFSGYDLFESPLWYRGPDLWPTEGENGAFRRWVGQRVQALANIRFSEHIQSKYPGIRATTWDSPNFGGNNWCDTPAMLNAIDGFTANCYQTPLLNYIFARTMRALDFDKEFQFMTWIGPGNLDVNARRTALTSIYAVGSNVIHHWEEPQRCYSDDTLWNVSRSMYDTFSHLPVFDYRSDVFLICGHWTTPTNFLKKFDAAHYEDAEGYGLGRYKLVLCYAAGHPALEDYVTGGGLAVTFNWRPGFLADQQIAAGSRIEGAGGSATTVSFGQGMIILLEYDPAQQDDSNWQLFVYDRIGALMAAKGFAAIFNEHFAPRSSGGRYIEITSDDGSVTCYFYYTIGQSGPPVQVNGTDVLSGDVNPVLGPGRSCAIVAHQPLAEWQAPPAPDRTNLVKPAEPGARRGLEELPELPPIHPLGAAKSALDPVPSPTRVSGEFTDWQVEECGYRLSIEFGSSGVPVNNQPIVISGQDLLDTTGLNNLSWASVRVFRGSQEQPIQIDERDGTGRYLAVGNGRVDPDDELVFAVNKAAGTSATYHIYCDTGASGRPTWPDAPVQYQEVSMDIAEAILSNGRLSSLINGPPTDPGGSYIGNLGTGAITELSLDGKPFTNIRHNWGYYCFSNPWSWNYGWSIPQRIISGPLRSIVKLELPWFWNKNPDGSTLLEGGAVNYFSMYGNVPVMDIEQRVEYTNSDVEWPAYYYFSTTPGAAVDENDVAIVPVDGQPRTVAMYDTYEYSHRYLEYRPEQGWMALLDPVEDHGCALFYSRMPEIRENLAWGSYAPAHQSTPSVYRRPDTYTMELNYTNRNMRAEDRIVHRFRIVGLTDEDGETVAEQYKVWGEDPVRLGSVEIHANESIEVVTIGDAGNAAATNGFGSVDYAYKIGEYEVTAGQYADFLNQKAKSDPYGLYDPGMGGQYGCRITRSGGVDNYSYSVAPDYANRPVTNVSYWSAIRFVNWLHNGQGDGDTETGAYTLNGYNGADGRTIARNPGWKYALPTEDEWYKAAHYKGGGLDAGYWTYQTQSDTMPSNLLIDPDPGNNASFYVDGYDYTGGSYYRTEVGEHENSESAYGTFDQGGNVWEYTEGLVPDTAMRYRCGGAWGYYGTEMINRLGDHDPTYRDFYSGFRVVAAVPGNVEVNVTLEDYAGDLSMMKLRVELLDGGSVAATAVRDVSSTSASVTFSVQPGSYTVRASAPKWLTRTVPVLVVAQGAHTVDISLPNGDMDGDDSATGFDLKIILKNME